MRSTTLVKSVLEWTFIICKFFGSELGFIFYFRKEKSELFQMKSILILYVQFSPLNTINSNSCKNYFSLLTHMVILNKTILLLFSYPSYSLIYFFNKKVFNVCNCFPNSISTLLAHGLMKSIHKKIEEAQGTSPQIGTPPPLTSPLSTWYEANSKTSENEQKRH